MIYEPSLQLHAPRRKFVVGPWEKHKSDVIEYRRGSPLPISDRETEKFTERTRSIYYPALSAAK